MVNIYVYRIITYKNITSKPGLYYNNILRILKLRV